MILAGVLLLVCVLGMFAIGGARRSLTAVDAAMEAAGLLSGRWGELCGGRRE